MDRRINRSLKRWMELLHVPGNNYVLGGFLYSSRVIKLEVVLWLRSLIADARIQSQAYPCGICGRQSGTGTGFSPSTVKPVRLATHVIRLLVTFLSHFYGTDKFLWYYDWSSFCNLVTLGFLLLCLTYKFNIHMLADLRICIDFVSCWIWAESSIISRTAC